MKATIIGCGWMGTAVAYAMHKLGYELFLAESNEERRNEAEAKFKSLGMDPPEWYWPAIPGKNVDIVISCATYKANLSYAKECVDLGLRYCDLGGNPDVSRAIQEYAQEKQTAPVFTDLGLAPGYINILAEDIANQNKNLVSIYLYVGGLPQKKGGRLNYNLVFSVEGLINEYAGKCRVLSNEEIVEVDALGGLEKLGMEHEAFHTKGAIGSTLESMKNRGVRDCCYRTIRYTGHNDYMRFLMDDCGLSGLDDYSQFHLGKIIEYACPPTKQDLVHMVIRYTTLDGPTLNSPVQLVSTIKANEYWTAMQIGTSFPAAAVAHLMAQGHFDHKFVPTYADIDVVECQKILYAIDDSVQWKFKSGCLS